MERVDGGRKGGYGSHPRIHDNFVGQNNCRYEWAEEIKKEMGGRKSSLVEHYCPVVSNERDE